MNHSLKGKLFSGETLEPKEDSLYSPEELEAFKNQQPKAQQPKPELAVRQQKSLTQIIGLNIEDSADMNADGKKKYMSFDSAQRGIISRGFEEFIIPSDLIDLRRSNNLLHLHLYNSITNSTGEWFDMAWMRQGKDLIIYEHPYGLFLEVLPPTNYPKNNIVNHKHYPSSFRYNAKNIKCNNALSFNIGNFSAGVEIPLHAFGSALSDYILRRKVADYPTSMPEPKIVLPEYFTVMPVGFEMKQDGFVIGGHIYRACRGAKRKK